MEIKEAYNVLGVDKSISDDDLKKKHRELSFKFHPDRFKEDPHKLTSINEAYQFIKDYREHPEKHQPHPKSGFWNHVTDFASFFKQNIKQDIHYDIPIKIQQTISFHEAALGCNKTITYEHQVKCQDCDGAGGKQLKNECKDCDGFGRKTQNHSGFVVQVTCQKCHGKGIKQEKCKTCSAQGVLKHKSEGSVNIPAGVINGNVLNLGRRGNFIGSGMFGNDEYSDVYLILTVPPHKTMRIDGNNIVSDIDISLFEALSGTKKEIETIHGNKEITILPKSKNKETIEIKNAGVKNKSGKHIVNLNVLYPDNIEKLLEVLK